MKYKFRVGDKVRIKEGMDLTRINIYSDGLPTELTIDRDKPGQERWGDKEYDNTPTYSVSGGWRIPQAFLKKL